MMQLVDTGLAVGASFDCITPVAAIMQNMLRGPSCTFLVAQDMNPLTGAEVSWALSRKGIDAWGFMVIEDTLMFSVAEGQARWAANFLGGIGVPVLGYVDN
jgi:hypothetical protein